jgi:YNFM family putative membrane transporter
MLQRFWPSSNRLMLPMPLDTRRIAVGLAGMGAFINLYAPQAILPLLAHDFDASAADVSMIMTASALSVALTAPFTGAIADVLGRKRVITAAMIALIVPTVMIAFAPGLDVFVFWRFVQGLLLPPIFAVTVAYIGGEWPASQATGVTGFYVSASGIGGFLGRFLTGLLADWIGWRGGFLAIAALTALFALGVIVLLPREKQFVRAEGLLESARQMLRHLRNPQLVAIYAVGFGVLFNFIAIFTFVNFVLAAPPFNLPASALGSIFIVYLLGSAITPLSGRAVGMLGRRQFVILSIAVWIGAVLLTLVASLPVIVLGLALAAACGFICQTVSTSYVAMSAKQGVSSAVGLYAMSFYLGGSVGAFVPGIAWALAGWPGTVALVIAVLIGMAAIVWTVWQHSDMRSRSGDEGEIT